jgi:hypothetical protein
VRLMPFRVPVLIIFIALSSALAEAQTSAPAPRDTPAVQSTTTASEDFELNIGERRITESDFEASTEVSSGGEGGGRGLDLRVGVMVRAGNIDVLLRNVQGRVRFRASLEPVLRLLDRRRTEPATPAPAAPTNPSP